MPPLSPCVDCGLFGCSSLAANCVRALDFPEVGSANSFECELFRSFEADQGGVPGQPEQPDVYVQVRV